MTVLAGRDQAAEERQPEHDLLEVVGAGGHVEAEGSPERVGEGKKGRGEEGEDQEGVLQAPRAPAEPRRGRAREVALDRAPGRLGRHFPAAAPRCFRYSSR